MSWKNPERVPGSISHRWPSCAVVALASALELTLRDLGWNFEYGSGVNAVQRVFMQSSVTEKLDYTSEY